MTGQAKTAGWKLAPRDRAALLARFPPTYARADDGKGVEAMVVRLDGTTDRPDGSTWHITWSLGEGRKARESNDVIAARGWAAFDEAVAVTLVPARWP